MPLPDLSKKNVTSRPIFESYFFSPLYRIPTISLRQSVTVFSNRISFFYHWTFFEQKPFCCVSSVFEKKSACPSMVYFLLGRILTNWSWMKKNWKQKKGKNKKTKIQKKNAFVIAQEILSVTKRFLQFGMKFCYPRLKKFITVGILKWITSTGFLLANGSWVKPTVNISEHLKKDFF
jgi:hypothetical protein